MKKILSLVFSCVLIFTLCSCGEKEDTGKKATVDLEYYAELGQIPECEYTIGADVETLKKKISEQAKENDTWCH